jgi:carboxyl-terminal processing protease
MHDKQEDLITYKEEISEILKSEIVSRYYFQKGRVISSLKTDPEILRAIEVLEGNDTYLAILDGTLKPEKDAPEEE